MKKHRLRRVIMIVLAVLILLFGVMMGITAHIMHDQFGRGDYPDHKLTAYLWYEGWESRHPREEVTFPSGDLELKGYIYGAENTEKLLVFAHGIGGGHEGYLNILMWYVENGWCVFAYDAAGSGYSPGDSTKGLVQSALDLNSALDYVEQNERLNKMPKVLLGHSWGGFAVAGVLNFGHDLAAVVSLSGYAYPVKMVDEGAVNVVGKVGAKLFHPFAWLYNKLVFGKYAGLNAVDGINRTDVPILIVHGEADTDVSYGVGIISQRDNITDPNAEYMTLTGEYSHHNDFFNSDACNAYIKEWNEAHQNTADLSYEERVEVYATEVDHELINQVNEPLLEQLDAFYTKALGQ